MARLQGLSAHISTVAADLRDWTLPPGAKPFDKVQKPPPLFVSSARRLHLQRHTGVWPLTLRSGLPDTARFSWQQQPPQHRQRLHRTCSVQQVSGALGGTQPRQLAGRKGAVDPPQGPGRLPGSPGGQRLVEPPQHKAPGVSQDLVPGPEWATTGSKAALVVTYVCEVSPGWGRCVE